MICRRRGRCSSKRSSGQPCVVLQKAISMIDKPRSLTLATLKVAALCLLASTALAGSVLEGTVTHVRDGDTIEIGEAAVRLSGLHAPEMDEAGGPAARAFMVDLVEGKRVQCRLEGRRSYDREIGTCALNGDDIAGLLVAEGLGRDCPRFSGGKYRHLEPATARREIQLPAYCRPR